MSYGEEDSQDGEEADETEVTGGIDGSPEGSREEECSRSNTAPDTFAGGR